MSGIKKSININSSGSKLTIGGGAAGGRSANDTRHTRNVSRDWAKIPDKGSQQQQKSAAAIREESKYGIGLTTMNGRSSDDVELIESPKVATAHTTNKRDSTAHKMGVHTTVQSDSNAHRHSMTHGWMGESGEVATPTSIWQNRRVEITVESAEIYTDPRTRRTSEYN